MTTNQIALEVPQNIKSLSMIRTRTVVGVNAFDVMVEVHLANGLRAFSIVGYINPE